MKYEMSASNEIRDVSCNEIGDVSLQWNTRCQLAKKYEMSACNEIWDVSLQWNTRCQLQWNTRCQLQWNTRCQLAIKYEMSACNEIRDVSLQWNTKCQLAIKYEMSVCNEIRDVGCNEIRDVSCNEIRDVSLRWNTKYQLAKKLHIQIILENTLKRKENTCLDKITMFLQSSKMIRKCNQRNIYKIIQIMRSHTHSKIPFTRSTNKLTCIFIGLKPNWT